MSKLVEFQTSTGHIKIPNRLRVVVYDNLKDVRKWGRWAGGEPYGDETYGVTNKQLVFEGSSDKIKLIEAIIRVDKDYCPTGLIAHAAIYMFTQSGNRLHKGSPIEKEELFCYIYGDLFHEVTKKLYKKGIWS